MDEEERGMFIGEKGVGLDEGKGWGEWERERGDVVGVARGSG